MQLFGAFVKVQEEIVYFYKYGKTSTNIEADYDVDDPTFLSGPNINALKILHLIKNYDVSTNKKNDDEKNEDSLYCINLSSINNKLKLYFQSTMCLSIAVIINNSVKLFHQTRNYANNIMLYFIIWNKKKYDVLSLFYVFPY